MHWLDTSALLVLSGAALIGGAFGFVRPVIRLVTIGLGAVAAAHLSPVVAGHLSEWNGAPVHPSVAVGATFVAALVTLGVAFGVARRRLRSACPDSVRDFFDRLGWLNRLVGAVVAAALAAGVLGGVVYVADQVLDSAQRERTEGSVTMRLSRERVAAAAGSLSDQEKAELKELVDRLKRSKPAPAGKNKTGVGPESAKTKSPDKLNSWPESKGFDDRKK